MKINIIRCPSCRAELIVEYGKRTVYCAYCQKDVTVDNAVWQGNETSYDTGSSTGDGIVTAYPKAENAVVRDAREKYEKSSARYKKAMDSKKHTVQKAKGNNRRQTWSDKNLLISVIILPILSVAIIFGVSMYLNYSYTRKTTQQVTQICEAHGAELLHFGGKGRVHWATILTNTMRRDIVDTIQKDILRNIDLKKREFSFTFVYPKDNVIRDISVDKKGNINVYLDETKTLAQLGAESMFNALTGQGSDPQSGIMSQTDENGQKKE